MSILFKTYSVGFGEKNADEKAEGDTGLVWKKIDQAR